MLSRAAASIRTGRRRTSPLAIKYRKPQRQHWHRYRSPAVSPVRFAILLSIFGPISTPS
jgi:hypothetical protein